MNYLNQFEIQFTVPKTQQLNEAMGSIMQGILMETIDTDYAAFLHQNHQPPYSQYVQFDKNRHIITWTINTLTAEAAYYILEPLSKLEGAIEICKKGFALTVIKKSMPRAITYEELAEIHMFHETPANAFTMDFLTTTSFKANGQYQLFPSINYIMNSLFKRWLLYAPDQGIHDFVDVKLLSEEATIFNYKLQSSTFYLERSHVPGFKGHIKIGVPHQEPLKNIYYLLADFASFAGVGIKTAIGMGAVKTHIASSSVQKLAKPRQPRI